MSIDLRRQYHFGASLVALIFLLIAGWLLIEGGLRLALPDGYVPTTSTEVAAHRIAFAEAEQRRGLRGVLSGMALALLAAPVFVYQRQHSRTSRRRRREDRALERRKRRKPSSDT